MAKCKGTRVTAREKKRMWDLYQELGSISKVAKRMRRNPSTVSRYLLEFQTKVDVVNVLTS